MDLVIFVFKPNGDYWKQFDSGDGPLTWTVDSHGALVITQKDGAGKTEIFRTTLPYAMEEYQKPKR